ncbi:hypothetical protein [Hydrogenophaga sp.]|uniref:hypothetical protein n=1 Tax=Hydrogenophaga sp. TaxID=1904254 RepID=UPI003D146468
MDISNSSSSDKGRGIQITEEADDTDLVAFFKIFGHHPEEDSPVRTRPNVPLLPLSQLGQNMAQLSQSHRLSLSSALANTPPGSPKSTASPITIEMVATPHDAQGMADEGFAWITKLLVQMEAMKSLSTEAQAKLLEQVPDLATANALAKQETIAHKKELGSRRIRTSIYSAMVMYWLTFGLGKVVGNAFGAIMVASGMPAASVYAPLITMLGVPFMQVIFGEPYGGAWRSAGASYGSPDQAAYINYQTAHALYIRAWLEGNPSDEEKYRKIMNGIVDGLIKREKEKKPGGGSRIPRRLRSNASVPDRRADGTVKPGQVDPSRAVVGAARSRSFITDEVPVHTFTVLNGMSGAANLFWSLGMGSAVARVPDAVAHTLLGSIAMISMFEWQNAWRAKYQGVDLSDGGHPAILGAKREAARVTLELWRQRCTDALKLIAKIDDVLQRAEQYLKDHDNTDKNWNDIVSYKATLIAARSELRQSLKRILASAKRAKKEHDQLVTRNERANQAAKRLISSMVGESPAPEPWLDGAPLTIRSVARVLGYMTVLAPTTAQAILLGMSLMDYAQRTQDAHELAALYNTTVVSEPTNALGLTSDQMVVATLTASTVAANAIVGWTAKTLYGLPLWEYGIHGVAGIATRAIKGMRKCLGLAPDTALPAPQDDDPENPVQPYVGDAYTPEDQETGDSYELLPLPKVRGVGSSSSSSSSDH